jgi:uncharacterized membrane protein YqiK
MAARFFAQRVRWGLTRLGWSVVALILLIMVTIWWFWAESFFAETNRVPSDILVVESWVGTEALHAAVTEFRRAGYRLIVVTGGYSDDRWSLRRTSFAQMARAALLQDGMPADRIVVAQATDEHSQRTYASAIATWNALLAMGERHNINVFTMAAHARRSRLVFAKSAPEGISVGVIAWMPPEYAQEPWWHSSERGEDLIKETAALPFESLLNGGRWRTVNR